MKSFGLFVLFAIAVSVATSKEIGSLSHLTKEVDRVLPAILIDVTSALDGEINDLVNGNSPLVSDLKDIIVELQAINQSLPAAVKPTARQIYSALRQLDDALHSGDFLSVQSLISKIMIKNNVLKTRFQNLMTPN